MACFAPNTFKQYKDKINQLTGNKYQNIFTDDFVKSALESQFPAWLERQGIKDIDEIAAKSLVVKYMQDKIADRGDGIKRFYPNKNVIFEKIKTATNINEALKDIEEDYTEEKIITDNSRLFTEDLSPNEALSNALVERLKSKGIDVNILNDSELQAKLKELKGDVEFQFGKPYGKGNPYYNKKYANEDQRNDIRKIVGSKKYKTDGTDVITLESDNHKFIYLIDHSSDILFHENLREAPESDGFGIRKKFNIDKIDENDIKEIIRNIAPFYDYSETRIRRVLQTIGIRSENLLGSYINAELKRIINRNNAIYGDDRSKWIEERNKGGYNNNSSESSSRIEGSSSKNGKSEPELLIQNGELYGFTHNGKIYLSKEKLNPNSTIHEYTHLWCKAVKIKNPELWNEIKQLLRNDKLAIELGKQLRLDESYKKLDSDAMISEIVSRLSGKNNRERLEKIQKDMNGEVKGLFDTLINKLKELWKWVGEHLFNIKKVSNINELTDRVLSDMVEVKDNSQSTTLPNLKDDTTAKLTITPTKSIDAKAAAKGSLSNKFIGYGLEGSSTAEYAKQAGDKANVGAYSQDDVVFVSINGKRGDETKRHELQDKTIAEALNALKAGAILVSDNKEYVESSDYNEGEKRLAETLTKAGAVYSEVTKDGHKIGQWKQSDSNTSQNDKDYPYLTKERAKEVKKRAAKKRENDTLSVEKIQNLKIYTNYQCSNGLFENLEQFNKNSIANSETIVFYSNSNPEKQWLINVVKNINSQREDENKICLAINPSDDYVKEMIHNSNYISVIKGKDAKARTLDNLYTKTQIISEKPKIDNADFVENEDMLAYSRKIQHLYNQFKTQVVQQNDGDVTVAVEKEVVLQKVLEQIRKEIAASGDERIKRKLEALVKNWEHVMSVISLDTTIEEDIDEYDFESEDVLWVEQHSTSNMPKDDLMNSLLSSFPTGRVDELGTPIYYDKMVLNNVLINVISGSKNSDEMIDRMVHNQRKNKFLTKLLENIEKDKTGRLKSILFTKYANLFKSEYFTINGDRIIDEATDFATTSINLGEVTNPDEDYCIFGSPR